MSKGVLGTLLLLSSVCAQAQERVDHRGAVGLLLGGNLEARSLGGTTRAVDNDWAGGPELGLTVAVGYEGNELKAAVRPTFSNDPIDWSILAGYRGYFGEAEVKTVLDLDLVGHVGAFWSIGPRIAFGVQYELSSLVGLYGGLGAQLGFGGAFRFGAELVLGIQLRSYLLE